MSLAPTPEDRSAADFNSTDRTQQAKESEWRIKGKETAGPDSSGVQPLKLTLLPEGGDGIWYTSEGRDRLGPLYGYGSVKRSLWQLCQDPKTTLLTDVGRIITREAVRAMYEERRGQFRDAYETSDVAIARDFLDYEGNLKHNTARRDKVLRDLGCELIALSLAEPSPKGDLLAMAQGATISEYSRDKSTRFHNLRKAVSDRLEHVPFTLASLLEDMIQADESAYSAWAETYGGSYEGAGKLRLWSVSKGMKPLGDFFATASGPVHEYKQKFADKMKPARHFTASKEGLQIGSARSGTSRTERMPEWKHSQQPLPDDIERKAGEWQTQAEDSVTGTHVTDF